MRLKNSFISILIIFLTGNSAAQFGSELGGDTLQESFVNFMQAITLVDITSVAAAFLFLSVVALFYYASLNIFEQVFLRLEEIIKEAMGDDARSIYRDNDHYPTGVKGMALAVGFISANGVTGLIGLFAGIALGLIGVAIPLVVQGKMMRIIGDTRIDEDGNLTRERRDYSRSGRSRGHHGGESNLGSGPLSPEEIDFLVKILDQRGARIEKMEDIEDEKLQKIQQFNSKVDSDIKSASRKLDNKKDSLKQRLRRMNAPESHLDDYFDIEDGLDVLKSDLRNGFDPSFSGSTRSRLGSLKESLVEIIHGKDGDEGLRKDYNIEMEADKSLQKIKEENERVLEDFDDLIEAIESNIGFSDDIKEILTAFDDAANWRKAGRNPQKDRNRKAIEIAEDLVSEHERFEHIEKADERMENIVRNERIPELEKLIKEAEHLIEIVELIIEYHESGGIGGSKDKSDYDVTFNTSVPSWAPFDDNEAKIKANENSELRSLANMFKEIANHLNDEGEFSERIGNVPYCFVAKIPYASWDTQSCDNNLNGSRESYNTRLAGGFTNSNGIFIDSEVVSEGTPAVEAVVVHELMYTIQSRGESHRDVHRNALKLLEAFYENFDEISNKKNLPISKRDLEKIFGYSKATTGYFPD